MGFIQIRWDLRLIMRCNVLLFLKESEEAVFVLQSVAFLSSKAKKKRNILLVFSADTLERFLWCVNKAFWVSLRNCLGFFFQAPTMLLKLLETLTNPSTLLMWKKKRNLVCLSSMADKPKRRALVHMFCLLELSDANTTAEPKSKGLHVFMFLTTS